LSHFGTIGVLFSLVLSDRCISAIVRSRIGLLVCACMNIFVQSLGKSLSEIVFGMEDAVAMEDAFANATLVDVLLTVLLQAFARSRASRIYDHRQRQSDAWVLIA